MKNPVFLVRHMYLAMKVRESLGRRAKPAVRPWKFATHKNTLDLVKKVNIKVCRMDFDLKNKKLLFRKNGH